MKYNVFPKLCGDCVNRVNEKYSSLLKCNSPRVVGKDPYALAWSTKGQPHGVSCIEERSKKWFAACGMKGKLWEPKVEDEEKCDCGCKR